MDVIDCGKKSFSEIKRAISSIFDVDLDELPVMRLDLAADIPGVPVDWFRSRVHARNKRMNSAYLLAHRREIRKASAQTLYFGKRPNLFRIYNKHEEWKNQYRATLRKTSKAAEVPTFESLYGVPEDGCVITRAERELGGSRLSRAMKLKHLNNAVNFRPFDPLEIVAGGIDIPNPGDYTLMDYAAGMFFREMAEHAGMQAVLQHFRRHSNGNTKKYLHKFRDFLPSGHPEVQLNAEYLNQLYQRSVWEQMAA